MSTCQYSRSSPKSLTHNSWCKLQSNRLVQLACRKNRFMGSIDAESYMWVEFMYRSILFVGWIDVEEDSYLWIEMADKSKPPSCEGALCGRSWAHSQKFLASYCYIEVRFRPENLDVLLFSFAFYILFEQNGRFYKHVQVSTLPVEEELIVMQAVRVTEVQYLENDEISGDMASLCLIWSA